MEALLIAVACALLSCSVKGNDWWGEFHEGIRHYSDEDLNKTFPEKTRPMRFKHPPFQCPDMTPSPTVPSSVEFVKAADIKVIAALGDSVTVDSLRCQCHHCAWNPSRVSPCVVEYWRLWHFSRRHNSGEHHQIIQPHSARRFSWDDCPRDGGSY
ncbi:uncharacterized protein LOC106960694 isoform X2 [Poecilia latipinna]|uniref:uncharacterized protein LOC106960694 isoform X2 n=1 Tax=Poecilia latipinna TaxID=48699 RepID=UPI00072EE7CA|nr:PREDICTED: uncharacterized protein LOC106960694 isoform X2 [Poecilia latipinna]